MSKAYYVLFGLIPLRIYPELKTLVNWSSIIRRGGGSEENFNFINKAMSRAYFVLFGLVPPRIYPELKTLLYFSPCTKKEECYMFEDHTILRIYGF